MKLNWIILLSLTLFVSSGIHARFLPDHLEDCSVSRNTPERLSDRRPPQLAPLTTYFSQWDHENPKHIEGFRHTSVWIKEILSYGFMIRVMEARPKIVADVASKHEFTRPMIMWPTSKRRPFLKRAPPVQWTPELGRPAGSGPPTPTPASGTRPKSIIELPSCEKSS